MGNSQPHATPPDAAGVETGRVVTQ
jgi:hypothetical protein